MASYNAAYSTVNIVRTHLQNPFAANIRSTKVSSGEVDAGSCAHGSNLALSPLHRLLHQDGGGLVDGWPSAYRVVHRGARGCRHETSSEPRSCSWRQRPRHDQTAVHPDTRHEVVSKGRNASTKRASPAASNDHAAGDRRSLPLGSRSPSRPWPESSPPAGSAAVPLL